MSYEEIVVTGIGAVAMAFAAGAGIGAKLAKDSALETKASSAIGCKEIRLVDSIGWEFRTLYLDHFGFDSGYSTTDLVNLVDNYYETEIEPWAKQGSTKGYHYYYIDTAF